MVENPAAWSPVEKLIYDTMIQHNNDTKKGVVGGSVVLRIYNALKERGILEGENRYNEIISIWGFVEEGLQLLEMVPEPSEHIALGKARDHFKIASQKLSELVKIEGQGETEAEA